MFTPDFKVGIVGVFRGARGGDARLRHTTRSMQAREHGANRPLKTTQGKKEKSAGVIKLEVHLEPPARRSAHPGDISPRPGARIPVRSLWSQPRLSIRSVSGDGNLLIRARTCPRKQLRFRHRIPINHGGVGWTRAACAMTHAVGSQSDLESPKAARE